MLALRLAVLLIASASILPTSSPYLGVARLGAQVATRLAPVASPALYFASGRDASRCVASCFEAVTTYTTPAYTSMDMPRAVTLVYRSGQAKPLVTLMVDAVDRSLDPPSMMSIEVRTPAGANVLQTNGEKESWYQAGAGAQRLVAQIDPWRVAPGGPTAAYDFQVLVRSRWPDGTVREAYPLSMRALVDDQRASAYGAGWSIAGIQSIYRQPDGSVVLTEGEGTVRHFRRTCTQNLCVLSSAGDFSTITYDGARADWTRRYLNGTTVRFDNTGRMVSIADRFGNVTRYEYGAGRSILAITDPAAKRITFSYDAAGRLRAIQDPGGRTTVVTVDAAGDLTAITDASGATPFRATYTPEHLLASRTDAAGRLWEVRYDFARRIESALSPTIAVDGIQARPTLTFRSLESALLYGAGLGTLALPRPRTTADSLEAFARVTTARGATTSFALGRTGAPLLIVQPGGRKTRIAYDAQGRVVRTQSPTGRVVRLTFQGPDLIERWDSTAGRRVALQYEPEYHELARLSGDVTPGWYFWSKGRLDSVRTGHATDSVARFTYDAANRLVAATDPSGHTTRLGYETDGFFNTLFEQADGMAQRAFRYDALGRLVVTSDDGVAFTSAEYDPLNRQRLAVGPLRDTSRVGYGPAGADTIIDAMGQRWLYRRNALGWVESETDPAGRAVSYRYDADGNVIEMINRRGQSVRFTYDALGLLASRTADGQTTTYAADSAGRFLAATNAESSDTVWLDALGRKSREITVRNGIAYELSSGYDQRSRRSQLSIVHPWSAAVGYHYDDASLLDELTDLAAKKTLFRYDADQLEVSRTLPNNVTIATGGYFGNHAGHRLSFPYRADLEGQLGVTYGLTGRGQLADRMKSDSTGTAYTYDEGGRLTGITPYWFEHTTYSCPRDDDPSCVLPVAVQKVEGTTTPLLYDAVGNPQGSGVVVESPNRLRRYGEYQMEYDADGNMTRKVKLSAAGAVLSDQKLQWNSLGQLASVTTNGSTVGFGYDGWGRRVRKTTSAGTQQFLWDGDDLFAELDGAGNRVTEYAYAPGIDQPHSLRRNGGAVHYVVAESPGHVIALLDGVGGVVDRYEYHPFGEGTTVRNALPNTLRYGAREYDAETGLYYNRARYYDPSLHRFVSPDPIGLEGGVNPYAYVDNAPLDARDPTGLCRVDQLILETGPDGQIKARCPLSTVRLDRVVITGQRDPFAEINNFTNDLAARTDQFREETARALDRARAALGERVFARASSLASWTFIPVMTNAYAARDAIVNAWLSSLSCSIAIQEHIAERAAEGAAVGLGGAAIKNAMNNKPLFGPTSGPAGIVGAATGAASSLHGLADVCK